MRVENGQLILERKNCSYCRGNPIPKPIWVTCPKCKGTGRRGSGRCRNCRQYAYEMLEGWKPGLVKAYDHDHPIPCPDCKGDYINHSPESYMDYVPHELIAFLEWKVIHSERGMSWYEQHIGTGLSSCVDYGRHKQQTDDELIEHERSRANQVQAIKVIKNKDDPTFATGIAIVTADQGYSMIPYWEE